MIKVFNTPLEFYSFLAENNIHLTGEGEKFTYLARYITEKCGGCRKRQAILNMIEIYSSLEKNLAENDKKVLKFALKVDSIELWNLDKVVGIL